MHVLQTFLKQKKLPEVTSGKGNYLNIGKYRYLDLTGGLTGHAILGWTNPVVERGIIKQLKKISHLDYKNYFSKLREDLAKILSSKKFGLEKIFFVGSSGAEACEASMKLSYQFFYDQGKGSKKYFISRKQSYHGCTTDALSVGERPNLSFYKPFFSNYRKKISEHNIYRYKKKNETEVEYSKRSAYELEKQILKIGANNVCAFIGETTLGGLIGDVPPAKNYWKYIRKICDKYNVHLILDEVWCGTGTSGKYHNFEWDNIKPDFVFLSKTLAAGYGALSAVLVSNRVVDGLNKFSNQIQYSNTHQGHLLSIAAALEVQKIIKNKNFLQDVFEKGKYLRENLISELKDHDFFYNVRGRGLRNSFEYNCDNKNVFGVTLAEVLKEKHKILVSGKWHRICLSPSLKIKKNEIDFFVDKFVKEYKLLSNKWTKKYYSNLKSKATF
jgi:adenosylmethionine-8-amino-7-oxononanoate aminotransferase